MSRTRKLPRLRPWHWWAGLGVLVVALLFGAWWERQPPPEPMYQGVPLSELLKSTIAADGRRWREVIPTEMGAEAIPYLAWAVEHGRHQPDQNSFSIVRLIREKILRKPAYTGPDERQIAALALGLLGSDADLAIPALAAVGPNKDVSFRKSVAVALCRIGPEAWRRLWP